MSAVPRDPVLLRNHRERLSRTPLRRLVDLERKLDAQAQPEARTG